MKDIKTRDTVKDIRTLDRAANIATRMKDAYARTKEQSEQTQRENADSPMGYAEDRATESVQDMTHKAGHVLRYQGKHLAEQTREKIKERHAKKDAPGSEQPEVKEGTKQRASASQAPASSHNLSGSENNSADYFAHGRDFARDSSSRRIEHSTSNYAGEGTSRGVRTLEHNIKKSAHTSKTTIKTSVRGPVKMAQHGIKTAEKTPRVAIKTTQATAKTAQATAKAAQRAALVAKVTAKTTIAAAKTMVKAIAASVKAIIAAVKGLIAVIVAGGWVAVVVIVVILLIASILGSVFGLFASETSYNGAPSMPEVVSQINAEFSARFDEIIADNPHDRLVIDNAGSASMVTNWNEVLAVYAVLAATDPDNPTEVATLDDAKIEKLKLVFWDMNRISYSIDTVEVGTDEETGEPITESVLTITVSYKTAESMISFYGFNAERAAQVRALLQPEYAELFQRLTGSYVDITLSATEIAAIIKTLPADLSEERKEVVLTAFSLLDKVHYFWGGKSLMLGWDSRWGTPMKVTADGSPTTGTVRPLGLDCSGFVDWVFYNAYGGEYIIGHGGGASDQYSYCDAIPWSSAQPGDLVFYPNCEHVGIVVKNDAGALTVIHCASGYNNVVMTQNTEGDGFAFTGRPQIYPE